MSQLSNSTHASNSHSDSLPEQPAERNYRNASDEQTLEEVVDGQLTLRALVSTKEASAIIGKDRLKKNGREM
ncbi:hypothetical protein BJV82DRAFT_585674 [Fennellomyces sp. T-0311]|nr:hypothetical protein BJV82DRAFT_585674 [Fennellomyces sp. T-0311]